MTDELAETEGPADDGDLPIDERADSASPSSVVSRWERWVERRRNRVSRWDRPPEPHDWRFYIGNLGRALIVTGLLMFGFVGYQLWGTGIETARTQHRLESQFDLAISTNRSDANPTRADDSTDTEPNADDPTSDGSTSDDSVREDTPGSDTAADDADAPSEQGGIPSAVVPGGVDLSDQAIDQDVPPIIPGEAFARLEIPKIGKELYVVPGVSLDDLKQGPGHYPDTPLPGQLGNAAIAGHRTTYGAPFFDVDQLTAGDELVVTMITGDQFVYSVTGTEVVSASDYWVVTTRDPSVAELTLTSCHPKYTARDRIVVHSVLVPERSSQVGVAEFYDLDRPDGQSIPGDDPTLESADETDATTDTTVDAGTSVDDNTTADAPAGTETAEDPQPAIPTEPDSADNLATSDDTEPTGTAATEEPEQINAFSEGWFDDGGAWPQIALWGFALTILSMLGYRVSKRTRHYTIGVLVSIAPFLFCLYFFYQNVNRLLPPGL